MPSDPKPLCLFDRLHRPSVALMQELRVNRDFKALYSSCRQEDLVEEVGGLGYFAIGEIQEPRLGEPRRKYEVASGPRIGS
jgi:hypothetical protein